MIDETKPVSSNGNQPSDNPWDITDEEQEAMEQLAEKQKLADIATDVAEYITSVAPQFDEEGKVNYYFSGSLASSLLPNLHSFKEVLISPDGTIEQGKERVVGEETRSKLLGFNRRLGGDIDVWMVREGIQSPEGIAKRAGNPLPKAINMEKDIPDISTLFTSRLWAVHFDAVSHMQGGQRPETRHAVIGEMKDGNTILIADPAEMVGYKIYEYAFLSNPKESVEADARSLYVGLKGLYDEKTLRRSIWNAYDDRMSKAVPDRRDPVKMKMRAESLIETF